MINYFRAVWIIFYINVHFLSCRQSIFVAKISNFWVKNYNQIRISDLQTIQFFPLKISTSSNRYLVDPNRNPFFLVRWCCHGLLSCSLIRKMWFFTLITEDWKAFQWFSWTLLNTNTETGHCKFITGIFLLLEVFCVTNEEYFAHVDYVIQEAQKRNILVLLDPLYLGYEDEEMVRRCKIGFCQWFCIIGAVF